ncbi:hypothetical protein C8Q76DRAFT_384883 [Earliella scabrosa]|nr:hypothetical protein C8Q76DRAFT_384883 [Earliella scabrosa]
MKSPLYHHTNRRHGISIASFPPLFLPSSLPPRPLAAGTPPLASPSALSGGIPRPRSAQAAVIAPSHPRRRFERRSPSGERSESDASCEGWPTRCTDAPREPFCQLLPLLPESSSWARGPAPQELRLQIPNRAVPRACRAREESSLQIRASTIRRGASGGASGSLACSWRWRCLGGWSVAVGQCLARPALSYSGTILELLLHRVQSPSPHRAMRRMQQRSNADAAGVREPCGWLEELELWLIPFSS